jgi:hypothetical protein
MKRMGLNIDGLFITDKQKTDLISYLSVDQPESILVINSMPFAAEMKGRFPYMNVIYRDMALPNQDNLWMQISPETWWNIYSAAANYGLVLHTNNEPAITKAMVDWEIECAKIAIKNKTKVVLCNFSVGTPETPNNNPAQYEMLKPLFKLICDNPDYLYLGLHEYAATNWYAEYGGSTDYQKWVKDLNHTRPNLFGRFKHINDYCIANFGNLPNIIITEWGFDTIHAYYNYQSSVPGFSPSHMGIGKSILAFMTWKTDLASWEQYAFLQLQSVWNALYKKEINIKGVCYFCWGGQGVWKEYYDISGYEKLIEQLCYGDFSNEEQKEINMALGGELRKIMYTGSDSLRFRTSPTTSASILFNLQKDQVGYEFVKSNVRMNGYDWRAYLFINPRNGNLELGWTAYSISPNAFVPMDAGGSINLASEIELTESLKQRLISKNS